MKMEYKKKLSQKYLEHMRNQLEYLNSINLPEEDRQRETSTLHDMLVVWSICEMMFVTGSASDVVIKDFLEWINLIDPGEPDPFCCCFLVGPLQFFFLLLLFLISFLFSLQRNLRLRKLRNYLLLIW